jgi:hypothetical protein
MWLWKIFVIVYAEFRQYAPTYQLSTYFPDQPLRDYFEIMNNDDCKWGAVLTVASNIIDIQNLVAIGNIKNLVALEIIRDPVTAIRQDPNKPPPDNEVVGGLEDSVVRSWMDMAVSLGCFKHLRIVRFVYQNRITPNILWMLEKMPALEFIVTNHCFNFTCTLNDNLNDKKLKGGAIPMNGWVARRLDWVRKENSKANMLRDVGPLLGAYRLSVDEGVNPLPSSNTDTGRPPKPSTLPADLPLLEFQLPWTPHNRENYVECHTIRESRCIFAFHRGPQPCPGKRPSKMSPDQNKRRMQKRKFNKDLTEFLGDFLT